MPGYHQWIQLMQWRTKKKKHVNFEHLRGGTLEPIAKQDDNRSFNVSVRKKLAKGVYSSRPNSVLIHLQRKI
jgi:hypothetical protein